MAPSSRQIVADTFGSIGRGLGFLDSFYGIGRAGDQADFQAAYSRLGAAYERFLAGKARERGEAEARRRKLETRGEIGRLRADFGASGVDANVGTPSALYADARMLGDYDAALIRHRAEMEAAGHDYRREQELASARFYRGLASAQKRSSILDFLGSGSNFGGSIATFGL